MKLLCPKCDKKEMELMSNLQIQKGIVGLNPVIYAELLNRILDWVFPSKYVFKNYGFIKDA